jgi:hypothetical protein
MTAPRSPSDFGRFHNGFGWMVWERDPFAPDAALNRGVWIPHKSLPFPLEAIPIGRPGASANRHQPDLFGDAA